MEYTLETFKLILTQFTDETIAISSLTLMLVFTVLVAYWVYNRRKFQQLAHQIPATVVKNYLDSIIQNSTALKSSLFRGGGLEMGDGIPSVVPVAGLPVGKVTDSGVSADVLNQKNAEIAALRTKLTDREKLIADLERRLAEGGASTGNVDIDALKTELATLQALLAEKDAALANAGSGGGDSDELRKQLEAVMKERDEFKERLQEYEIIEEDLANLKRLQQENVQLKKTIESIKGGGGKAAPVAAAAVAEEVMAEPEETVTDASPDEPTEEASSMEEMAAMETASEPEAQMPAIEESVEAPAEEMAASDGGSEGGEEAQAQQKSAEELLNEFEKMLG